MFTVGIYVICLGVALWSWFKDREKTRSAFRKAWRSFSNILPQFLGVLVLIAILLAYFDHEMISRILGEEAGWWGVIIAALVGAVTLIPGFVAFPTAALLIKSGAGLTQMAAFISTLMMVGIVTIPMESEYFGKKITIYRNLLAFLFSFIVAWLIGVVVG